MKIGITGGSGLVGKAVSRLLLSEGHEVVVFSRNPAGVHRQNGLDTAHWDPEKHLCETGKLSELDAVINLSGAGIADQRWTSARKQELYTSRIGSTELLLSLLRQHGRKCRQLISASATGYYGPDRGGHFPFSEEDECYPDFLGRLCGEWERAALPASEFTGLTIVRLGVVLSASGGAFSSLYRPMKWGLAPIPGGGRQVLSWIHEDDLAEMFLHLLRHQHTGIFNAVSPAPVELGQLIGTIREEKGGGSISFPVPAKLLKLVMGEMSETVLQSCTVSAEKISGTGFMFRYDTIEPAVHSLLGEISLRKRNRLGK